MAEAEDADDEGPKSSSGGKMIIMIALGAVVLVFASMALTFALLKANGMLGGGGAHGGKEAEAKVKPAAYFSLEPAFVVNIRDANGRMRFLQVKIDVQTHDEKGVDIIKTNAPALRNTILFILSTQTIEGLSSPEGKERLRATTLEELQKIMETETGKKNLIDNVFFSSIVMQ